MILLCFGTMTWSHCPSYLLIEVLLEFCSLKAAGITISQPLGQRNFLGLFHFGLLSLFFFFICLQQRDSSVLREAKSCSDLFAVLKHRMVYKKDRNG